MLTFDDTIAANPMIDQLTQRIVHTTRFRGARHTDGKELFAYQMDDGTYFTVESVKGLSAGAKEMSWISGRLDASGRGFRASEPRDLHNAVVGTFHMPSPVFSRDDGHEVVDEIVVDAAHAKVILEERITSGLEVVPALSR